MRPAARLHQLAGSPTQDGCEDHHAHCVVCAAEVARTMPYDRWQGATFTDQNKLRGHGLSDRVCEPCVWAHAWNPPPGWVPDAEATERKRAAKRAAGKVVDESKERPPNLRLFSHLYDERGYVYANKGDKPTLRAWLCSPKVGEWWAAIADTGQKHVVPWARRNRGQRGVVRFEAVDVVLGSPELVTDMCSLLTTAATKEEIASGAYSPRWQGAEQAIRAFESRWERERGGGWFDLALWLAQRDEEQVKAAQAARAEGKAKDGRSKARRGERGDGVDAARGARRVPRGRSEPAQALGPAPDESAVRGAVELDGGRVGDGDGSLAGTGGAEQLALFGDAGTR